MKARLFHRVHVACPNCGAEAGRVDHLFSEMPVSFGPWYCDECGREYRGRVESATEIHVEAGPGQIVKTVDLLVLDPQPHPVYFVVDGINIKRSAEDVGTAEGKAYLYEEGTCPTNFIQCARIISEGDTDPHGLFRYARSVDRPAILDGRHSDDVWREIFPEAFPGEPA